MHSSFSNCDEHCNVVPTSPFRNKGLVTQLLGRQLQGRQASSYQLPSGIASTEESHITKDMSPSHGQLSPFPHPQRALKGHPILRDGGWLKLLSRLHYNLTFPFAQSWFHPVSFTGACDPNCTPNRPPACSRPYQSLLPGESNLLPKQNRKLNVFKHVPSSVLVSKFIWNF